MQPMWSARGASPAAIGWAPISSSGRCASRRRSISPAPPRCRRLDSRSSPARRQGSGSTFSTAPASPEKDVKGVPPKAEPAQQAEDRHAAALPHRQPVRRRGPLRAALRQLPADHAALRGRARRSALHAPAARGPPADRLRRNRLALSRRRALVRGLRSPARLFRLPRQVHRLPDRRSAWPAVKASRPRSSTSSSSSMLQFRGLPRSSVGELFVPYAVPAVQPL